MKRFRWGDVVPGCGDDPMTTEDEILAQAGVYAALAHGSAGIDPVSADLARRLQPVD